MRIKENFHEGYDLYSDKLQKRVTQVFQYTSQKAELSKLLVEIREECVRLKELFLTNEEQNEIKDAADFFDANIKEMVYCTFGHLETYEEYGWKELIYEGDDSDE